MRKFRILIVCPEPQGLSLLTSMLKSLGHLIEEAPTDRAAVRFMERNPINLVLASVDPGDAEALELLTYVRRKLLRCPGHPDVLSGSSRSRQGGLEAGSDGRSEVSGARRRVASGRAAGTGTMRGCAHRHAGSAGWQLPGRSEPGPAAGRLATPPAQHQPPAVEFFPNNGMTIPLPSNPQMQMPAGGQQGGSSLGGHRSKAGRPARGCRSPRGAGAGNRPGHRRSQPQADHRAGRHPRGDSLVGSDHGRAGNR